MGLRKWLLSMFPSYKWCGCKETIDSSTGYQFRVRNKDDGDGNLLQLRQKRECSHCSEEEIDVLVEETCEYQPKSDIHERSIGSDGDMMEQGFMDKNEMAKMLIEMRLADCLRPVESLD